MLELLEVYDQFYRQDSIEAKIEANLILKAS